MDAPYRVEFSIPYLLPLTNVLLRMHWRKRRDVQRDLSWAVWTALEGKLPTSVIDPACVTVTRHSVASQGGPDYGGLVGGTKLLEDVLCLCSRRHPFGLGFLQDDAPKHCKLVALWCKVSHRKEQRTHVIIEELTHGETAGCHDDKGASRA
jgi:hypothetical protein